MIIIQDYLWILSLVWLICLSNLRSRKHSFKYRQSLTYNGLNYGFSTSQWCESNRHSWKLHFKFWILIFFWESEREYDTLLQLPASHRILRVHNQHTNKHSVPTQPFFLTFTAIFNKLCKMSILYFKIGFY